MVNYVGHGGHCCGVSHIYGFDGTSVEEFDRVVREHFEGGNGNRILEAILSDRQVVTPLPGTSGTFHASVVAAGGWPPILASRGFVLVEDWVNSNTNRRCYRFIKLAGRHNNQTTMESLRQTPLPFNWDTEPLTIRVPLPVVELPPAQPVFAVGGLVINQENRVGTVVDITNQPDGRVMVLYEGTTRRVNVPVANLRKATRATADGTTNAPVDVNLPVAIRNLETGEIVPARHIERDLFTTTARSVSRGSRLDSPAYYNLTTGRWRGSDRVARVFNPSTAAGVVVITPPAPPAPPVENREVLTEYFASFRSGRRTGPYETMEALRAENPRVLSFVTRRVFSDGTVTQEGPARIPA